MLYVRRRFALYSRVCLRIVEVGQGWQCLTARAPIVFLKSPTYDRVSCMPNRNPLSLTGLNFHSQSQHYRSRIQNHWFPIGRMGLPIPDTGSPVVISQWRITDLRDCRSQLQYGIVVRHLSASNLWITEVLLCHTRLRRHSYCFSKGFLDKSILNCVLMVTHCFQSRTLQK